MRGVPSVTPARGARLVASLPRGRTLPVATWRARHRGLLLVLALHVLGLPVFGQVTGWSWGASIAAVVPAAVFGLVAVLPGRGRTWGAAWCAMGLLSCSAALVVLWHGAIEAHFHYFVMVSALSLYEEWSIYALAVGYVVLQHGLMAQLSDDAVFAHPMGMDMAHGMWFWAAVHGIFIAFLSVFELVSWGANESVRREAAGAHAETARAARRMHAAFEHAPVAMAIVAADGEMLEVNVAMTALFGDEARLVGAPFWEITRGVDRDLVEHGWPLPAGEPRELRTVDRDGAPTWTQWSHSAVPGGDGRLLLQGVDVTQRRAAEAELAHRAMHDPLTGLANRDRFSAELAAAVAEDRRSGGAGVGVLFVDLDNFKLVNDSLGHSMGDEMLIVVAERLRHSVRPGDLLARFGGDEFVVCARGATLADVEAIADRIADALIEPIELAGQLRFVTASVGIALHNAAQDLHAESLAGDADAAMYRAKAQGKARRVVFDETLRTETTRRFDLENDLRRAFDHDELELDFQPLVAMADRGIVGAEALVRWRRPGHGRVPPLDFVPLAEQCGLIVPLGAWVVREACREAARQRSLPGNERFVMGVNLSAVQLADAGLVATVEAALAESGLPAEGLCLEVTESAVLQNPEEGREAVRALARIGVHLALDDFGTGQSSLSLLRWLAPVSLLKLDKSFVREVATDERSAAVVRSMLDLARTLGLDVVVEGIDDAAQADVLAAMGSRLAQGFHFARPMTGDELVALLGRTLPIATPAVLEPRPGAGRARLAEAPV